MPEFTGVLSQNPVEFGKLLEIYKELQPMHVLEIGTQEGGTLYQWLKYAPDGAIVCNLDILSNQSPEKAAILPELWKSWARPEVQLYTIIGDSHREGTQRAVMAIMSSIDFIFIDGDHTYDGSKQDWEMYGPLVGKGGIIAFHDLICPGPPQAHIQVGRVFREIKEQGYKTLELYSRANQHNMGIGVVYV